MLKLTYHTAVFGPIDLEYDRPVIRVGSSEDNDLVLPHPSVAPHHCLLAFRGDKVVWLPPEAAVPSGAELDHLNGPELGPGDPLCIGELQFTLAHSSHTISVPATPAGAFTDDREGDAAPGIETGSPRYYCPHCRAFIPETAVKRVGLLGRAKRDLCPKCSHLLETHDG